MHRYFWSLGPLALLMAACATTGDDGARLVTVDHYVRVKSTALAIAGQDAKIYIREVALAGTALRGGPAPGGVVLFVHGAGTPAEVTFDVPYKDYSWMAYLAKAGFDVFSMDMTGYGRSTRPPSMNDPCNFSKAQQAQFVPNLIPATCAPITCARCAAWTRSRSWAGRKAVRAGAAMRRATRRRWRAWSCWRLHILARPRPKRRTRFRPAAVR